MFYLFGLLISLFAGFLIIRFLTHNKLKVHLQILLGLVLGFGIDGTTAFYVHILCHQFNRVFPILLVLALIAYLFILKTSFQFSFKADKQTIIGIAILAILAIPLFISGHYYPLGGWDAWSCWSLKAKFIFLGHENWKDVLAPSFWRSNTQYPLLWPLINVWFWDLEGKFDQAVPMLNSIIFTLLTAGILLFGILELTGNLLAGVIAAAIVTALPFNITLYTSQYSDALLGLFFLSAFISLLLAKKFKLPKLNLLGMMFLGLMSFTKSEGLVAAGIATLLIFWQEHKNKKELKNLILVFLIAALPTIIFTLFIAPRNEAFVNGLTSPDKPSTLSRLLVIGVYPWFEFISNKWNGFWIVAFGGIILAGKKLWTSTLGMMGLSLILYLLIVMAYYEVNTFFEINWWLSTTLSRILFAIIPSIALWISVGLLEK